MPKLYEYFGLVVMFYSNEHEPVHVHGLYQGRECRADFVIVEGVVVDILFRSVRGRYPLLGISNPWLRRMRRNTEQSARAMVSFKTKENEKCRMI